MMIIIKLTGKNNLSLSGRYIFFMYYQITYNRLTAKVKYFWQIFNNI